MGDAFMGAVPSAATTARTVIVRSPQAIAMTEGGGSKPPVPTLISICETPRDQAAADQQAIPACGGRLRPRRFFHCDGSGPGPPG
jgi:hypothetical protein